MGNLDTPDSMGILIFVEITLNHLHYAFYTHFNNVLMVITKCININKTYLTRIYTKFIKFVKIQLIQKYLNVNLAIWNIVFRDLMGLMCLLQMISETLRIVSLFIIMHKICIKYNGKIILMILLIYHITIIDFRKNKLILHNKTYAFGVRNWKWKMLIL